MQLFSQYATIIQLYRSIISKMVYSHALAVKGRPRFLWIQPLLTMLGSRRAIWKFYKKADDLYPSEILFH